MKQISKYWETMGYNLRKQALDYTKFSQYAKDTLIECDNLDGLRLKDTQKLQRAINKTIEKMHEDKN